MICCQFYHYRQSRYDHRYLQCGLSEIGRNPVKLAATAEPQGTMSRKV